MKKYSSPLSEDASFEEGAPELNEREAQRAFFEASRPEARVLRMSSIGPNAPFSEPRWNVELLLDGFPDWPLSGLGAELRSWRYVERANFSAFTARWIDTARHRERFAAPRSWWN